MATAMTILVFLLTVAPVATSTATAGCTKDYGTCITIRMTQDDSTAQMTKSLHLHMVADEDLGLSDLTSPVLQGASSRLLSIGCSRELLQNKEHPPAPPSEVGAAAAVPADLDHGLPVIADPQDDAANPLWTFQYTAGSDCRDPTETRLSPSCVPGGAMRTRKETLSCEIPATAVLTAEIQVFCQKTGIWRALLDLEVQVERFSTEMILGQRPGGLPSLWAFAYRFHDLEKSEIIAKMIFLQAFRLVYSDTSDDWDGTPFTPKQKQILRRIKRVSQVMRGVRAGRSAWMSASEWNTLMHIVYGNTMTTTTTTPKPKAKAKATATPAPKAKAASAPKKNIQNQANPPFGSATFALSNIFEAAWSLNSDATAAAGQLIGHWQLRDSDITETVKDFLTKVHGVIATLKIDYVDDLETGRKTWIKKVQKTLQEYLDRVAQEKADAQKKEPTATSSPVAQRLFPNMKLMKKEDDDDFVYVEPDKSDHVNSRFPTCTLPKLHDNSSKEAYRVWRLQARAWVVTCQEQKYLHGSVRIALLSALDTKLNATVTQFFGVNLGKTTVKELVHYLDEKFSLLTKVEDQRVIKEFRNFTRPEGSTLTQFLSQYKSLLSRAVATKRFTPASDIGDDLMRLANIKNLDHGTIQGMLREKEEREGTELTGYAYHEFIFECLVEVGHRYDQIKFNMDFASQKVNFTNKQKKKKTKGKGKGKGRKKGANAADEHPDQPPAKKIKTTTTVEEASEAFTTTSDPTVRDLATAFFGEMQHAFFGKGQGKGKGKGSKGKGSWGQSPYAPFWQPFGGWGGGGKGKKGKSKGKSKGKGKGKGKYDANTPSPIAPANWGQTPGDWRCLACKAFNYASRTACFHCTQAKPAA